MHGREGVHGRGVCVVGACVAEIVCMVGGVHGREMHGRGRCAWQGAYVAGGMHGTLIPPFLGRYYEIQSMSRQYAFYWNAFLFVCMCLHHT